MSRAATRMDVAFVLVCVAAALFIAQADSWDSVVSALIAVGALALATYAAEWWYSRDNRRRQNAVDAEVMDSLRKSSAAWRERGGSGR